MIRAGSEATRFATYVAGGVLTVAVDVGVMQSALFAGVAAYSATSLGFCAGLLVNYVYHAKVTFKSPMDAATFSRYLSVTALSYFLTLAFVALSLALVGDALFGKIVSLPVLAVLGFQLSKRWIYR